MCLLSFGSSPSQMIAVCLALFGRCRSMQFAETFSVPSSNHLIWRLSGSHETSLTLVNGLIQSRHLACSAQNPAGSCTDCVYIAPYLARSISARSRHSDGTGITVSDMAVPGDRAGGDIGVVAPRLQGRPFSRPAPRGPSGSSRP